MDRAIKCIVPALVCLTLAACVENSATKPVTSTSSNTEKSRSTIVYNYDGTGKVYSNATLQPATKTMSAEKVFGQGQKGELLRIDTTGNDCSPNTNFNAAIVKMPGKGSLVADVQKINSNYPVGSPREHCNGTAHQELVIYDTPNALGDDLVIVKVPTGGEILDITFKVTIR